MLPAQPVSAAVAAFPFRAVAYTAAKIILAALVIWTVAGWVDTSRLAPSLAASDALIFLVAVFLALPNLWLQFSKWRLLVRRALPEISDHKIAVSLFTGFALALVTPARLGEYGGRALSMPGAGAALLAGLTAVDKMAALLVTVGLGSLSTVILLGISQDGGWTLPAALTGGAAILLAFAVLIAARRPVERALQKRIPRRGRWGLAAHRVLEAVTRLSAADLRALVFRSAAFYSVFLTQFALFLLAQGGIGFFHAACGASVVMLLKTVVPPVTFGELGIREGASVLVFSMLGVPGAVAFNASILLFIVNVLLPAIVGTVLLFLPQSAREAVR